MAIQQLFLEEQKRCYKGGRRTDDLLYMDQHIHKESKVKQKKAAIAWIDYKMAYDMFLQSWIVNCQKMYKISDKVIKFNIEAIKN